MSNSQLPIEHRRLVRAWIWFWYCDATRLAVLLGVHVPLVLLGFYAVGGPSEYQHTVAFWAYAVVFGWALLDNDYTQLERIGLDVYRRPLPFG